MTLLIKNGEYAFLIKNVIMKGVPVITNFKRSFYQTFNQTNLLWNWCKTFKLYEKSGVGWFVIFLKCDILIIDTWNEYIKKSDGIVNLFSIVNVMLGCLLFKKF